MSRYNCDYSLYGNEVYEKITTRIAHWWNYEDQNWFAKRVDICLERLLRMTRPLFVDIGFSIPYLNADARFSDQSDTRSLLVDKHTNVSDFYRAITKLVPSQRQSGDRILIADVEEQSGRACVRDAVLELSESDAIGSLLLSAMEVIEHLKDDGHFWELAADVASKARHRPVFYITLPIGKKIPSHNMSFASEDHVIRYLERRMIVQDHFMLSPSESEVSPYLTGCICAFGKPRN